ncbi:MAG: discoidin domain-containing protein [Nostoc sp.]|uniref:discoidin domain-containing protein n=1 Tax=Nostoc sp. TaxID=1180 RepID=UPI002FF4A393
MTEIRHLAITKTVADAADLLVMQNPTTGETYNIKMSDFLAGLSSSTGTGNTSGGNNTINRCLNSNGGTIIASSTYYNDPSFSANSIINGDRKGNGWGSGGGWNSGGSLPQWVVIDFGASYSISKVNIFTIQDAYGSPSEPTLDMTFSAYGITAFDVQCWYGSAWTTVKSFTGNNKVWTQAIFSPVTTDKIRIYITAAIDGNANARLIEVEAY